MEKRLPDAFSQKLVVACFGPLPPSLPMTMDIEKCPPWRPTHKIVVSGDQTVLLAGSHFFPVKNGSFDISRSHEDCIRAALFNETGTLLVTGGDDKNVMVWDTKTWACLGKRKTEKKVTGVAIMGDQVIWCDRVGAVFQIEINSLSETTVKAKVLLGHCSWISEMLILPYQDTHLILTADRDEKIRVSYYPDAYDILSYCLGHTTFVSAICLLPPKENSIILSGGSDNTLYVWDFSSGELITTFSFASLFSDAEGTVRVIQILSPTTVAILLEEHNAIEILKVTGSGPTLALAAEKSISLPSRPFGMASVGQNLWVSTLTGIFEVSLAGDVKELPITKQFNNYFEEKVEEEEETVLQNLSMKLLRKCLGSEQNQEKKQGQEPPAKKKRKRVGGKAAVPPKK